MSTQVSLGDENFVRAMKEQLNAEMLRAAEPVIKRALEEVESAMRKALAARLVGMVDSSVSFERYGNTLRIEIVRPDGASL